VDLVSEGLTNPQIGIRLLMGRATVKTHLEHIFNKIGVRSRSELASAAARRDPKVPAYVRVSGASRGPDSPRRSL
jgi:DNA-binding CsgD family transcriptional regulator